MSKKIVEITNVGNVPVEVTEAQKPKVGQRARQLILEKVSLTIKAFWNNLKKEYPEGKTSMACVAWYKSDLKKVKVDEDKPFKDWLKANESKLRAEFEASLEPVVA